MQVCVWAQEPTAPSQVFKSLEARGARIGTIRVLTQDIFDTADPQEDKWLFRWANKLHVPTRPEVIQRALLFKTGEPVSARLMEETERLLRSNRFLYDVQLRAGEVKDGVVDIDVITRDTWSLEPGASAGRAGGANSGGIHLKEHNLLGTGTSVSFGRSKDVDRSSNEFRFSNERAFGTWTAVSFSHANNSDGRLDALSVMQPFYALDARWTAGFKASKDDRIDSVYNAGSIASQYRHQQDLGEVFVGWSAGLKGAWVSRYTVGLSAQKNVYRLEPGAVPPAALPRDETLVAPFVRFNLIEDRIDRELNRNLIGRPEYFALGLASSLQLGWASTGLGSTQNAWLVSGTVSRGFEPWPDHTLMASGTAAGQLEQGQVRRKRLGAQAQYYLPQGPRWLFYASAAGDYLARVDPAEQLMLGGDSGLRGYPLRYQSGTRRALFTVEERFYTDLYVWRLFRVGGAAFLDAGRAWGGDNANALNPGWLSNAGVGLRVVSARSAFGNVLHMDIALPLNASADIKKIQFLMKTKASF